MKQMTAMLLALLLLLALTGCREDTGIQNEYAPGRMVRRIEVSVQPLETAYERTYVTQENMGNLLDLLRSMESQEEPEQEPDVSGGQVCYTATVTFANGEQSVYYLLGHQFLRLGDDPWCCITPAQSATFINFLKEHPSDDGSVETTSPAETQ